MQVILPFFAPCGFGVRHGFLQHSASFCDKQEPHSAQLEARVATGLHKGAIHPGEAAKQFILALVGPNTARKIMLSRHLRRVLRSPHRSIAARRGAARPPARRLRSGETGAALMVQPQRHASLPLPRYYSTTTTTPRTATHTPSPASGAPS